MFDGYNVFRAVVGTNKSYNIDFYEAGINFWVVIKPNSN